jgi:hypothetical protein
MITITQRGSFDNTENFLNRMSKSDIFATLHKYGDLGVRALANATPRDSGVTAASWYYEIVHRSGYFSIRWHNSNVVNGVPIAILIEYGHGTREGGFVHGREYIMAAIQPIFDQMANDCWKEVTK